VAHGFHPSAASRSALPPGGSDGATDRITPAETDRLAAEWAWVRARMALGEEPLRPPGWVRRIETPTR
jgi:hypothetical protein